jgi:phosphocarrier protein
VEKDGEKVNGKSIMGLMMLAAGPGSKVTVYAHGHDASQALAEIEILIKRKFDEE